MSLYAPQPRRPLSRSSITTTLTQQSSPPSSWSSGMPRSNESNTSITTAGYSEQGTETPLPRLDDEEYGEKLIWNDEPLIDFEDDADIDPVQGEKERPADRLKMLLRQMEVEVEQTKIKQAVVRALTPPRDQVNHTSHWRQGRKGILGEPSRSFSDNEDQGDGLAGSDADGEEDSPPTPPPRITNPYSSRRNVEGQTPSTQQPRSRITSRAAVLRNSITHQPEPRHPRTPLETFIATHDTPISDPSSSRSYHDHSSSSSSSRSPRKGKQRATEGNTKSTIRRSHTPRKTSIELAPDDSAIFAQEAASLEVQGDVLDLSASSIEPPWNDDQGDSTIEEPPPLRTSLRRDKLLKSRLRDDSNRSLEEERSTRNSSHSSGRLSRVLRQSTVASNSPTRDVSEESLPPLPEPSFEEDEDSVHTAPSRPASLFRSPSKSRSYLTPVKSPNPTQTSQPSINRKVSPNISRFKNVEFAPPEPIHVGMVQVSTPVRTVPTTTTATPHPPGRWYTPNKAHTASPLARVADTTEDADVSVHRLRISPAKKASVKQSPSVEPTVGGDEGDSSFLGRIPGLSRMIAKRHPLPLPSSAVHEATEALAKAAQTSSKAKDQVESSQRQFLEALASAQIVKDGAVAVVKQTWGWGNWTWWICVELLLVWAVFRVTLDYATSAQYLASIDPFSITANSFALSVPLPNGLSRFLVPRRGSANFFDLLEKMDLWRRLDRLGVFSGPPTGVVGGVGILGGVPT